MTSVSGGPLGGGPLDLPLADRVLAFLQAGDHEAVSLLLEVMDRRWAKAPGTVALHGLARLTRGDVAGALPFLEAALAQAPAFPQAHLWRARALFALGQGAEGEQAAAAVLTACPPPLFPGQPPAGLAAEVGEAHNLLARAALRRGDAATARTQAEAAVACLPDYADAWNVLGLARRGTNAPGEAEQAFRRALSLAPDMAAAWSNLGNLLADRGDLEGAEAALRQSLALHPRSAETYNNLALVMRAAGRRADAVRLLEAVLLEVAPSADHPVRPVLLNTLANVRREIGDAPGALTLLDEAAAIAPNHAITYNNRGLALLELGDWEAACAAFRRALDIDPSPAAAWANLAGLLAQMRRLDEAEACVAQALARQPDQVAALGTRGLIAFHRGDRLAAMAWLEKVLAIDPDNGPALASLASIYREKQFLAEAEATCRRAIAAGAADLHVYNTLGVTLLERLRLPEAEMMMIAALDAAEGAAPGIRLDADRSTFLSNLCYTLLYDEDASAGERAEVHGRYQARIAAPLAGLLPPPANRRDPARRLRVGYVSADFRTHSVAYFFAATLAAHDRAAVEVILYASVLHPDSVTAQLRALADGFVDVAGLDDRALANRIRADGIDVLVDLSGHSSGNRLPAFARRPAPVQVTWLGYPYSTGLAAMDGRIVDALTDPPGATEWMSETPIRLSRCFLAYRPTVDAPEPFAAPCQDPARPVTFGSFNTAHKIGPSVVAAWAAILRALPEARLFLKAKQLRDDAVRAALLDAFAAHGIAAGRLDLMAFADSPAEHLALYGRIDLALDTFPYNGTTTTCEAMWMGVPVLTLRGDAHQARVGHSLLAAVGLETDLVAFSREDYVARAVALGADRDRLAALRQGLRQRMADGPLGDAVGHARALEAAYRGLWIDWCARGDSA